MADTMNYSPKREKTKTGRLFHRQALPRPASSLIINKSKEQGRNIGKLYQMVCTVYILYNP